MTKLLNFLARTPAILFLLIAFTLLGASFYFVEQAIGGPLLDVQINGADALARLSTMTDEQKHMHMIATLTLDTFYPLAYGGLFIGIVARFAKKYRRFLAVPAFVAVLVDFTENIVQSMALAGSADLLATKDFLTPLKFGSVILAAVIALTVLAIAIVKWIRGKRT